jgi:hypothetical protein
MGYQFKWFFNSSVVLVVGVSVLALCGVLSLRFKSLNVVSLGFLTMCGVFYWILKIPNYHWYYGPLYAFGFFYAGLGFALLLRRFAATEKPFFKTMGMAMLLIFMFFTVHRSFLFTWHLTNAGGPHPSYRAIGLWLKENSPPESTIATGEIGTIGLYSERRVIDILGLVNAENAGFIGERRFREWLRRSRPDYIAAHDPFWAYEQPIGDEIANGLYVEVEQLDQPGFKVYKRVTGSLNPGALPQ